MVEFRARQLVTAKGAAELRPMRVVGPAEGEPGKLVCRWPCGDGEYDSGVFDADALEPFQPTAIIGIRTR